MKGDLQVSMIDTTNLKDIIYTDLDSVLNDGEGPLT